MHRSLKEATARPPKRDAKEQQEAFDGLVYGITNGDGSGYNRKNGVQLNTKSKVEGAITNEE